MSFEFESGTKLTILNFFFSDKNFGDNQQTCMVAITSQQGAEPRIDASCLSVNATIGCGLSVNMGGNGMKVSRSQISLIFGSPFKRTFQRT